MATDDFFVSYEEWRDAMHQRCRIDLSREYCAERVRALQDLSDPATVQFIELFGQAYRDKVSDWFERAGMES